MTADSMAKDGIKEDAINHRAMAGDGTRNVEAKQSCRYRATSARWRRVVVVRR